ncbi:hypothetical protein CP02DC22_0725B, partial [Chlamydia psittaci 02DC22]
LRNNRYPNHP